MLPHRVQFSSLSCGSMSLYLYLLLEATDDDDDGLDNKGRLAIGISILVLVVALVCGTVIAVVVLKTRYDVRTCKFTQEIII